MLPKTKDFWAGITFMVVAGLAIYFSSELAIGTTRRMGPRYFPLIGAGCLMVLGAIVAIKGLEAGSEPVKRGAFRPSFILLSVLLFALLLQPFGFVIALCALICVSALAGDRIKPVELVSLCIVMVLFSTVVFIWGLGLPLKIWPV
nr:tripartite tricarboxylate transporter TctB family protein [Microvirga antarctica]